MTVTEELVVALAKIEAAVTSLRDAVNLHVDRLDRDIAREVSRGRDEHAELWAAIQSANDRADRLESWWDRALGIAAGIGLVAGGTAAAIVQVLGG